MVLPSLSHQMSPSNSSTDWFWSRIDNAVVATIAPEQRIAIDQALLDSRAAGRSPIGDIRLSFGRFFLVVKWGREKRSQDRLLAERARHPVVTMSNAPVLLPMWLTVIAVCYLALAIGVYMIAGLFA